ncbi:MAG: hypothetical protein M3N53_00985 [Actinomycetota bacterium]|nr:hypothetical protein [Actinomycetota bacterium]
MLSTSTLKELSLSSALGAVDEGAAFVDLRPVRNYLDVHIPRSLSLQYENGPGFQSRARDCIPLDIPLVLLHDEAADMIWAAACLRGRGFAVLGTVQDGLNAWANVHGTPASTEIYRGPQPRRARVLDVTDPGTTGATDATTIPIEQLWGRAPELKDERRVVVAFGYGVRAALAVGILERTGIDDVIAWDTRGTF